MSLLLLFTGEGEAPPAEAQQHLLLALQWVGDETPPAPTPQQHLLLAMMWEGSEVPPVEPPVEPPPPTEPPPVTPSGGGGGWTGRTFGPPRKQHKRAVLDGDEVLLDFVLAFIEYQEE
jgi:hypothetical protein